MRVIIILLLGFLPSMVYSSELSILTTHLQAVMQNKTQLNNTLNEAKQRTALCQYCHGSDGISNRPYIPNLAGQHPIYLLKQMLHFANGTRKSQVMEPLAKQLTKDDIINIAIYYANMKVPNEQDNSQIYDARTVAAGSEIYQSQCANCHGDTGQGSNVFPRLSGQKVTYVIDTLKMFATPDSNKNNPLLYDAVRSNPEMVNIVRKLKPADMRAVANFIATLH